MKRILVTGIAGFLVRVSISNPEGHYFGTCREGAQSGWRKIQAQFPSNTHGRSEAKAAQYYIGRGKISLATDGFAG